MNIVKSQVSPIYFVSTIPLIHVYFMMRNPWLFNKWVKADVFCSFSNIWSKNYTWKNAITFPMNFVFIWKQIIEIVFFTSQSNNLILRKVKWWGGKSRWYFLFTYSAMIKVFPEYSHNPLPQQELLEWIALWGQLDYLSNWETCLSSFLRFCKPGSWVSWVPLSHE